MKTDITHTNERFSELSESSEFLNLILNNISSCIMLLDKDLKLRAYNDPLLSIFSNKKNENLLYRKCGEVIGTKKHLVWLCEKLGPLAYTNPSLLIAKSNEMAAKPEDPSQPLQPDRTAQPSDFMKILCPKCKCQVNIRL